LPDSTASRSRRIRNCYKRIAGDQAKLFLLSVRRDDFVLAGALVVLIVAITRLR
jgi:hypothetical protein